jgi:hypothetical protein
LITLISNFREKNVPSKGFIKASLVTAAQAPAAANNQQDAKVKIVPVANG